MNRGPSLPMHATSSSFWTCWHNLQSCRCSVKQSESVADVDTDVMSVAIELAQSGAPVIIYAADTNILALLVLTAYHGSHCLQIWCQSKKWLCWQVYERLPSQGREPAENQQMAPRSCPAGGGVVMLGLVHTTDDHDPWSRPMNAARKDRPCSWPWSWVVCLEHSSRRFLLSARQCSGASCTQHSPTAAVQWTRRYRESLSSMSMSCK